MVKVTNFDEIPTIRNKVSFQEMISGEHLSLLRNSFDAHAYMPPHTHEYEQLNIFLQGTADVQLGDQLLHVKSGDIVIYPPNVTHSTTVTSDGPMIVLEIFSPPHTVLQATYDNFVKEQHGK